jgi:hypothetical protein
MTDQTPRPADQTAVLVTHASRWSHQRAGAREESAVAPGSARSDSSSQDSLAADRSLTQAERRAALSAARYAVAAYSGPIGELISRELHSYVDAGVREHVPSLAPRLILGLERAEARNPIPEIRHGWAHLPAQYIPGTPMHWRYRDVAEAPLPTAPADGT